MKPSELVRSLTFFVCALLVAGPVWAQINFCYWGDDRCNDCPPNVLIPGRAYLQFDPPRKACIPCQVFCWAGPIGGLRVATGQTAQACGDSSTWTDVQALMAKSLIQESQKYYIRNLDEAIRAIVGTSPTVADHLSVFGKDFVVVTDKRSGRIRLSEEPTAEAVLAKLNGVPGEQRMSLYRALPTGTVIESRFFSTVISATALELRFDVLRIDESSSTSAKYGPAIVLSLVRDGDTFQTGKESVGFDTSVDVYRMTGWKAGN